MVATVYSNIRLMVALGIIIINNIIHAYTTRLEVGVVEQVKLLCRTNYSVIQIYVT